MKVLLVSPVAGRDGAGGDVTYTQTLVANPPPGVRYETYDDALARGALRERGIGRALKALLRGGPRARLPGEAALTLAAKAVHLARARRWLYWEPFRFFEVRRGEYDLIHTHIFSARFEGLDCPLVISCGGPLSHLYLDARHYSQARVAALDRADLRLGRALGVNVPDKYLPQAKRLMVYSERARAEIAAQGTIGAERIDVVPTFQATPPLPPAPARAPFRVGFVARNFEQKGGETLLRAWPLVRQQRPDAHLTIAGSPQPQTLPPPEANIEWLPYVARARVLNELLPSFDVFAYPTSYDYLPCYTLLEVMARGVPVAGSDHRDMDIALGVPTAGLSAASVPVAGVPVAGVSTANDSSQTRDGQAGLISPTHDAAALAHNILRLLEPETNRRFRAGARAHFEAHFSREAVLPLLSECYRKG